MIPVVFLLSVVLFGEAQELTEEIEITTSSWVWEEPITDGSTTISPRPYPPPTPPVYPSTYSTAHPATTRTTPSTTTPTPSTKSPLTTPVSTTTHRPPHPSSPPTPPHTTPSTTTPTTESPLTTPVSTTTPQPPSTTVAPHSSTLQCIIKEVLNPIRDNSCKDVFKGVRTVITKIATDVKRDHQEALSVLKTRWDVCTTYKNFSITGCVSTIIRVSMKLSTLAATVLMNVTSLVRKVAQLFLMSNRCISQLKWSSMAFGIFHCVM